MNDYINLSDNTSDNIKRKKRKDGEGSVYQLDNGKWVGKLYLGKKPDGKPNRKTFSGKTEAEVKKKIREFNKNKEKYLTKNIGKVSFQEYVERWLYQVKFHELKPSSFDRLESTVKAHIIPHLGYLQLNNIQMEDVRELLNTMNNKGLSHSSIKKAYDACGDVFSYALIRDLEKNPMLGTKMIPADKIKANSKSEGDDELKKHFTEEEIKRFETEAIRLYKTGRSVYNYGYAFILMLNTGIRMGEALGIDKYKDIDLERNTLRIRRNVVVAKERDKDNPSEVIGYETKLQDSTKTETGDRLIPLNKSAKKSIEYLIKNCDNNDSRFLISNPEGNALSTSSFSKTYYRILEAANIEKRGLHTLRHTFASTLFKNGVDVKIVSELLGHSNVTITYNTYIHLIKEQKVKAIQSLDFDMEY